MEKQLKKLPQGVTKKELIEMYKPNRLSRHVVLRGIHLIIIDNRLNNPHWKHFNKETVKKVREILPIELREFVAIYGLPQGYFE